MPKLSLVKRITDLAIKATGKKVLLQQAPHVQGESYRN
jgi:hypothetical protein